MDRWAELRELADSDILDLVYPAEMHWLMDVVEAARVVVREWGESNPFLGYSIETLRNEIERRPTPPL